jgi:hypothetical protein
MQVAALAARFKLLVACEIVAADAEAMERKEECSFLKKRTKKLLIAVADRRPQRAQSRKSFLLLFFKKEDLPSLVPPWAPYLPRAEPGAAPGGGLIRPDLLAAQRAADGN